MTLTHNTLSNSIKGLCLGPWPFLELIFMSLILYLKEGKEVVIEEIREEVLSVSNSEPNVIQENSLQGEPFKTVLISS